MPEPTDIIAARKKAELSAAQAARLVYVDSRTWRRWEAGEKQMPEGAWELFKIKSSQ